MRSAKVGWLFGESNSRVRLARLLGVHLTVAVVRAQGEGAAESQGWDARSPPSLLADRGAQTTAWFPSLLC